MRYRGAIPEARPRSEAEVAESKERLAVFEGTYGRKKSGTSDFCAFIEKTYLPWAKANKRSWRGDVYSAPMLIEHFRGKTFAEISPLIIEKFKCDRMNTTTKNFRI